MNNTYTSESSKPTRLVTKTSYTTRSIVSYGLMVKAMDTGRWLIVKRKHSAEFMLFLKGTYRLAHLICLIHRMTAEERQLLIDCISTSVPDEPTDVRVDVYTKLYAIVFPYHDQGDIEYSILRCRENVDVILSIIRECTNSGKLDWTWPKGRPNILHNGIEDGLECAKREFTEETGIELPDPINQLTETPVVSSLRSIMGRMLETRCWLYIIPMEISMDPVDTDNVELSDRRWVNYDELQVLLQEEYHSMI